MLLCQMYLKYKHFPSEGGDGVKVSLTDVWAVGGLVRNVGLGGSRRRRGRPRLCSCEKDWSIEIKRSQHPVDPTRAFGAATTFKGGFHE